MNQHQDEERPLVGLGQTIKSVLSSFFGVQSEANRARDFQHGNPVHFIVIALIATIVFVLVMWGVVSLILGAAQGPAT